MPPSLKDLSSKDIIIIVATVVGGSVLLITVIACLCTRRRQLKSKEKARFLDAGLRGGRGSHEEAQEVVEFMKSGSFETSQSGSSTEDSQPSELGYTTRSWHEIPRALQPGQANTALPVYRPVFAPAPKIELADTSIVELPPKEADLKMKPSPLNFSRPSREQFRLNRSHDALDKSPPPPVSILKNADTKPDAPNRVSSPTIPTLLQQLNKKDDEGRSSPVSPLTVRGSISVDKDKPRRVSFVSEVSTIRPPEPKRNSDPS